MDLRIHKLDQDYDAPHVELSISGDGYAARQDSYVSDDEWLEFSLALNSIRSTSNMGDFREWRS
jgi:hypothetical protein